MGVLDHLAFGFSVAFSLENLAYCGIGVLLGTLVGVLPGLGPLVALSLLFPITFTLPALPAVIMFAGIWYGAQYGGSTTSILVNLPGETASAVTCLDGYQMARQGRAGPALAAAAVASLVGGSVGTLLIALFGPPLAEWALAFGSAEYFSLMLMGLVASAVLTQGDLVKGLAMVALGLVLGLVGADVNSGLSRFAFGLSELTDGIGFTVLVAGLFAVSEVVANLEPRGRRTVYTGPIAGLMPTRSDLRACAWPALRGTAVGAFFGVLPGTGPAISAFAAYILEKKIARDPSRFGRGAIEGVVGPEAANNASAQTAFIPMLTLGVPGNAAMGLMLGALVMQGIAPGPQVMTTNPELFWGVIASMWIGNLLLVVLNLPLVGIWVRLLAVPYRWLFPTVIVLVCLGNYSVGNSVVDVYLCAAFGVLGYVLGPLMEENLRRAMLISRGDPSVFFTRPISLAFMAATVLLLLMVVLPALRGERRTSR